MARDEPYNIMTRREIDELKKQLHESRSKRNETSSGELLDAVNALARSMDAMLKLFTEAAEEARTEGGQGSLDAASVNEKLDGIISQNREIIEMIGTIAGKQKGPLLNEPIKPHFQAPPVQHPSFQQPPPFEQREPMFDNPEPQRQGPVAMPSLRFPDNEPNKKGLFGRLRK